MHSGGVNKTDTADPAQNDTIKFTPLFGSGEVKFQMTPKAVTPFAGMASFFAWLGALEFPRRAAEVMPFEYRSPNAIAPEQTLLAFISAVVVGASRFAHAGWLRHDKAFHALLGVERFPGEDAIRRFFHRFTQARIEAFWRPLWKWMLELIEAPRAGFSLDLDSTVFSREGHQQGVAKGYNPRRAGRKSHHPILAVLAEMPFVLHTWLRPGNTGAGRDVVEFLKEALKILPVGLKIRCVRADSGFFDQKLLGFLEERGLSDPASKIREGLTKRERTKMETTQSRYARRYDREFKENAVALVESGREVKEVARDLGVSQWSLKNWCKQSKAGKEQTQVGTLDGESSLQREVRRMRQEIDYLRRQRDILKKALGIVSVDVPGSALR